MREPLRTQYLGPKVDLSKLAPGEHRDGAGLYLIVRETGSHTWSFRSRGDKLKLGTYPEMDEVAARAEAIKARTWTFEHPDLPLEAYRTGVAPVAANAVPTFEVFAMKVLDTDCEFKNRKTRVSWLCMINGCGDAPDERYMRVLHGKPMDVITKHDLANALEPYWRSKPSVGREHRKNLYRIWKLAIAKIASMEDRRNIAEKDVLEPLLPKGQKARGEINGSHEALLYPDMPKFWTELRAINTMPSKWLQFTILTGVRSCESRQANDDQIVTTVWERGAKMWQIPGEVMKNGEEAIIPVTPLMQQIIDEMQTLRVEHGRPNDKLLFPGITRDPVTGQSQMQAPDNMRKLIQRTMGYDVTAHGFRSTFKSFCMDETDHGDDVSEACLHHIVGDAVRNAYARGEMWRKRKACLQEWGDFVTGKRLLNADREEAEKNNLPLAA